MRLTKNIIVEMVQVTPFGGEDHLNQLVNPNGNVIYAHQSKPAPTSTPIAAKKTKMKTMAKLVQ